ncbi:MAG: Cytosol aminopeptidase PepA (EC [uncultured Sulfurovum sp.]|uniref:Probable cytosol aminopeptidase n=1 Tax=uncultured Sulfurovum sp. TaxID=269237 RepID=A0A6S6UF04_9BACT|nr:MAG: Cytosol aminopeptidase PepA (EC [uncultured Sulfurovum sp.]
MNLELTIAKTNEIKSDIEVIFVIDNNLKHHFVQDKKLLKKSGFSSSQDETCLLVSKNRLYVGVSTLESKNLRTAAASACKTLLGTKYKSIKVASYTNKGCTYAMRAMVEGFILGAYRFENYKSKKNESKITHISISLEEYNNVTLDIEKISQQVHKAQIIADATNFTRDIVNTPPEDCYPDVMASIAENIAKDTGLDCHILKPKKLKKEKMETLLAVARASRHAPRVIHLVHKPKNTKQKPTKVVTLVGKGLTYDSGGLSLKPADFMVNMKSDKGGGSAVLGIMKAVAELDLPIEVHGFVGAVENMIGGDAYKPDDVLVAKNGKTIEIRNTDAEGRLVLADVLCYAQQEVKSDYLFDFATLTGASVVAVGHYTSSIMGHNKEVQNLVVNEAHHAGELATALDFNPYLKKTIKSEIADICNISNTRYGGAITAGQFLSEFVDKKHTEKWAHIDIAGPAFVEHAWGENPHGASGAGVRMMVKLLENLSKKSAK